MNQTMFALKLINCTLVINNYLTKVMKLNVSLLFIVLTTILVVKNNNYKNV